MLVLFSVIFFMDEKSAFPKGLPSRVNYVVEVLLVTPLISPYLVNIGDTKC